MGLGKSANVSIDAVSADRDTSSTNNRHSSQEEARPTCNIGWQLPLEHNESAAMSRKIFEKTYLNPPVDVRGNLRKTLANPTPLGLVGFLVATFPISFQLMGWAGAGGGGAATIGLTWFFGGMLQMIACIMEWILGNTFSFLVFGTFGAAWLGLAATSTPAFNAIAAYTANATTPEEVEAGLNEFYSSFAFALVVFGLLMITFGFCALRTNIIFVSLFGIVSIGMFLYAASYWELAKGHEESGRRIQVSVGAIFFACCCCAWYLLIASLVEALEFGFSLPVGDLSARYDNLGRKSSYRSRSRSV